MIFTIAKLLLVGVCLAVLIVVVYYAIELIKWLWRRRK